MRFFKHSYLVLAVLLALWQLGASSYWTDEVFSLLFSHGKITSLLTQVAADVHPPLYFILLHFWIKLFGESEFMIRLLSVLPFLLSLYLIYLIGKDLFDEKTGRLAAFLCSISPVLILYSRMARYYSLTACLLLLAFWLLLKIQQKSTFLNWAGYIIANSLLLYADYPTSAYFFLGQLFVFIAYRLWKQNLPSKFLWHWALAQLIIGFSYLPWLIVLWKTLRKMLHSRTDVDTAIGLKVYLLKAVYPFYSFIIGETLLPLILVFIMLTVISGLVSFALIYLWKQEKKTALLLAIFSIGVILINALFLSLFAPTHSFIYYPRAILFAVYFWLLLVAVGISRQQKTVQILLIGGICLVSFFSLVNIYRQKNYLNPFYVIPWYEVATYVSQNYQPGDAILSDDPSLSYYLDRTQPGNYPIFSAVDQKLKEAVLGKRYRRFWLVITARDSRQDPMLYQWLWKQLITYKKQLSHRDFAVLDKQYLRLKEKLRQGKSYQAKLSIYLFE